MHIDIQLRRTHLFALVGALLLITAGGVAYASIPDQNGVFTACELKSIGTIRLIDPSLGSTSLLGHCTSLESQVTWNHQGQPGANGISPTVVQLSPGDSHCPAGGAAITGASGPTAYVCSGQNGADGKSFTGSFTSPSGQFSLKVSDAGVVLAGPGTSISLDGTGLVTVLGDTVKTVANNESTTIADDQNVTVGHDRIEHVGNNDTVMVGHDRTENVSGNESVKVDVNRSERVGGDDSVMVSGDRTEHVGSNETLTVGGNRTHTVGGSETVTVGGVLTLGGSFISVNGGSLCRPAARVGDSVDTSTSQITTGSPTVCIG